MRQHPQYTIAALEEGIYIIGMKDQFNRHDLPSHPLHEQVEYIADDMGFILFSRDEKANVDIFGPYFIEQYILMEILSKQEVAQNVLEYYVNNKEQLQSSLATYNEAQGKGFICWRFLMNEAVKAARAAAAKKEQEAEVQKSGSLNGGSNGGPSTLRQVSRSAAFDSDDGDDDDDDDGGSGGGSGGGVLHQQLVVDFGLNELE